MPPSRKRADREPEHCGACGVGRHCVLRVAQMVLRLFLDKGDALLCEQHTYPHIAESLVQPAGLRTVPVAMDGQGMLPGALQETLEGFAARGERPPRLLYTVPVGQNPTGARARPARPAAGHRARLCAWRRARCCCQAVRLAGGRVDEIVRTAAIEPAAFDVTTQCAVVGGAQAR